jgi:hypothetical protein
VSLSLSLDVSELSPDLGAGEFLNEAFLFARVCLSGSVSLSGRCLGRGEDDLETRRGRVARGERLIRRCDRSRLDLGRDSLRLEMEDRL